MSLFCCALKNNRVEHTLPRAVSSAGRATGLHPVGRRFEPVTAHHKKLIKINGYYQFARVLTSAFLSVFKPISAYLRHNLDTLKQLPKWVLVINAAVHISFLSWIPVWLIIPVEYWISGVFIVSIPVAWLVVTERI